MYKSYYPKAKEIQNDWVVIDAAGQNLGRLTAKIAATLLGKHKPTFTPGVPMGDYVVVINAAHITVTGTKITEKTYYKHSGYPGGLKSVTLKDQLKNHPDRVIRDAVWGMLPKTKFSHAIIKRLKVYGGGEHPHGAQVDEK
ncbi:MAG: 50S ribosomal protein L13 [Chloroflexi bacterium]|nr:50S ribosomal protein L13 [Chloroflexota bacterium]